MTLRQTCVVTLCHMTLRHLGGEEDQVRSSVVVCARGGPRGWLSRSRVPLMQDMAATTSYSNYSLSRALGFHLPVRGDKVVHTSGYV
jgi:hypothetical protein